MLHLLSSVISTSGGSISIIHNLTLMLGEDQTVKVWDLASGLLLRDLHGHTDFVYSLVFSRDSALLASGQLRNHVVIASFHTHLQYTHIIFGLLAVFI